MLQLAVRPQFHALGQHVMAECRRPKAMRKRGGLTQVPNARIGMCGSRKRHAQRSEQPTSDPLLDRCVARGSDLVGVRPIRSGVGPELREPLNLVDGIPVLAHEGDELRPASSIRHMASQVRQRTCHNLRLRRALALAPENGAHVPENLLERPIIASSGETVHGVVLHGPVRRRQPIDQVRRGQRTDPPRQREERCAAHIPTAGAGHLDSSPESGVALSTGEVTEVSSDDGLGEDKVVGFVEHLRHHRVCMGI